MYIKRAQLDNFGKFYQKTIHFSPGLNVIYGENESGKSTLHSFLVGMLFGMEKSRGRSSQGGAYQHYEPWNVASYYTGSLDFCVAEKNFTLERNFYYKEKTVGLSNREDGEELSVEHGDLAVLLGGMSRRMYENTCCISQAAVVTEADFARELQQELINTIHGGDAGIDIRRAEKLLEQKRRQTELKLKQIQQQKQQRMERLEWEQDLLESDMRVLEQKLAAGEKEKPTGTEENADRGGFFAAGDTSDNTTAAAAMGASDDTAAFGTEKDKKGFWCRIPIIGRLMRFLRRIWRRLCGKKRDSEVERGKEKDRKAAEGKAEDRIVTGEEIRSREAQKGGYGSSGKEAEEKQNQESSDAWQVLREQLLEKKTRLFNIQEEMIETSGMSGEERELQVELKSIRLAGDTLIRVAKDSYQEDRDEIQTVVSQIFSEITGGVYDRLEVTEDGKVFIYNGDKNGCKRLEPWQLSRGTMEQLYFALRLGLGRCLMQEEVLPILLDETFCAYDDLRLRRTLQWLAKQPGQTILFTSQRRELTLLEEMGVAHRRILL